MGFIAAVPDINVYGSLPYLVLQGLTLTIYFSVLLVAIAVHCPLAWVPFIVYLRFHD